MRDLQRRSHKAFRIERIESISHRAREPISVSRVQICDIEKTNKQTNKPGGFKTRLPTFGLGRVTSHFESKLQKKSPRFRCDVKTSNLTGGRRRPSLAFNFSAYVLAAVFSRTSKPSILHKESNLKFLL